MIRKTPPADLREISGDSDVLTAPEALSVYSYDGTTNWSRKPDVVFPKSTQEVSNILMLENREKVPVTPRGGGSIPIAGGIVLCMTKMDKILNIDRKNMSATVEAGIILQSLATGLACHNLFFPPDPQSFLGATLGGAIAENARGPACLKYGITKQYILGLEVVLPTGKIAHFGGRALKNVVGYDMLHLFVSSEGTLCVVTVAELKLKPIPPARKTILVAYNSMERAGESVSKVSENAVIASKIELLDNWLINGMEDMMHFGLPRDTQAVLLFETDGIREAVEREAEKIVEIVREQGALYVRVAENEEEANRYWMARRAVFGAITSKTKNVFNEDVTVPIGKIPALVRKCKELSGKYELDIVVLGHAGDGNLHPAILTDFDNKDLYERSVKAIDEIMEAAIELGGVLSGEHGIGLEKPRFIGRALESVVIDLMKGMKALLDPNSIMNPGKIWEQ